jgi:histidyl-tRNA synthetase
MRDLLPDDVAARDHVLSAITGVYRQFGYQRIETPALEDITRLRSGEGADNEKLIYEVLRRGLPPAVETGTELASLVDLGLRYDLTVPLTRFYANNQAQLPTPFRSMQVGPVWRAERPQKGRYRQFYQCDIDMIGEPGVLAEGELIEATVAALSAVGLGNVTVRLSDRRFLSELAVASGIPETGSAAFFVVLDKLDKIGWDGVRGELAGLGLTTTQVDAATERIGALTDLPAGKLADAVADALPGLPAAVVDDLASTAAVLDGLGVNWAFDPTLVRGMGYYTGQIFEITSPGSNSSIAGGGRYDNLIGRWLGRDVPACGFSIGFERIVDLLGHPASREAVAVLTESGVPVAAALAFARQLRQGGRVVEVIGRSGKLPNQLKRLEAAGFTAFVPLRDENGQVIPGEERPLRG